MLIVLEGLDGSGKTFAARVLKEKLPPGTEVLRFPDRSTPSGKVIDRWLKEGIQDPYAFQSLMLINRIEKFDILQAAHRSESLWIICERYWQSGLVYGAHDGIEAGWLSEIHSILPEPDFNFFLDTPIDVIQERRRKRDGNKSEAYEKESFDQELRARYLDLWDSGLEGWHVVEGVDRIVDLCRA